MFEVHVVNGEGDKVFGPFDTMAAAATEKERWQATGGCSLIEVRPAKAATVASEAVTPGPAVVVEEMEQKPDEDPRPKGKRGK